MLEKAAIFAREWLPLCAASQIMNRGDYVSATIGGWPVFAVRDALAVRAYRNTCRHQNMMIVEKPAGHCDILQCRYHGWRYGLDGRFIGAPPLVAPADPTAQNNHLVPLPTGQWRGLVFASLREGPPDFAAPEEATADDLSGLHDATFAHVRTTDIACNWKTFVEQRLADNWRFAWPLLTLRSASSALIAEQIVPRSFLRSRIVSFVIGTDAARPALASDAERAILESVPRIEEIQQRYQSGDTRVLDAPAVHAFRARVQSAIAG